MQQWKSEGGPDFEAHRTRTYPTEAHPDDLPSNALGALLGLELRIHNTEVSFDLQGALRRFFDSLSPFPDVVAKKYSHNQVVMGLRGGEAKSVEQSRREWFTALPLYLVGIIEPANVIQIPNASAALKRAGVEVYLIQGRPIGIRRVQEQMR